MDLQFNTRDPLYLQVVQYFKEQISIGAFAPGETIPSRRELANRLKINPNTVQRAYKKMEEEGLIFTEGNLPSKITTDEKILKQVRQELIIEAVETFLSTVQSIRVPLEEILKLIEKRYQEREE